jgi:hypothetical protein
MIRDDHDISGMARDDHNISGIIRDDHNMSGGGGGTRVYCNRSNMLLYDACSPVYMLYVPIICAFHTISIYVQIKLLVISISTICI